MKAEVTFRCPRLSEYQYAIALSSKGRDCGTGGVWIVRKICYVIALLILAYQSTAQAGQLGLFSNKLGTNCNLEDSVPRIVKVYVIHEDSLGSTGSQFSILASPGFTGEWISDTFRYPVAIGTTQSGVSVGYGDCFEGGFLIATVRYFVYGTTASCAYLEVVPHPVLDPDSIIATDCDMNTASVLGGRLYINPHDSCLCGGQQEAQGEPQLPPSTLGTPPTLRSAFESAASEFDVPVEILVTLGYEESRWTHRDGRPSVDFSYGVMGLRDNGYAATLLEAAELIDESPEELKRSPVTNIRGAAALLRKYFEEKNGTRDIYRRMRDINLWGGVVKRYSGFQATILLDYYERYFYRRFIIPESAGFVAGEDVAQAAPPNCSQDYYPGVDIFVAADPDNYRVADRPYSHNIDKVVIHVAEGYFLGTLNWWTLASTVGSAHYVVGDQGQVGMAVCHEDIAGHTRNSVYNARSIGIEHEGFRDWSVFTDAQYEASADLVRWISQEYSFLPARANIIGHKEVPNVTTPCPGTRWDWCNYMTLIDPLYICPGQSGVAPSRPRSWGDMSCFLNLPGEADVGNKGRSIGPDDARWRTHLSNLRIFRDFLKRSGPEGTALVHKYYRYSPEMASIMTRYPSLLKRTVDLVSAYSSHLRNVMDGNPWVVDTLAIERSVSLIEDLRVRASEDLASDLASLQGILESAAGESFTVILDQVLRMGRPWSETTTAFQLFPNQPNPFNPTTTIFFHLPQRSHVRVSIYDIRGRQVATLVDGPLGLGNHEVVWNAAGVATGVYFCRAEALNTVRTRKIVLLK